MRYYLHLYTSSGSKHTYTTSSVYKIIHNRCGIIYIYTLRLAQNILSTHHHVYNIIHTWMLKLKKNKRKKEKLYTNYLLKFIHFEWFKTYLVRQKVCIILYTTDVVLFTFIHFEWFKTYLYHIECV